MTVAVPVRGARVLVTVTEWLTRQSLILRLQQTLSEADQDHVVDALRKLAR